MLRSKLLHLGLTFSRLRKCLRGYALVRSSVMYVSATLNLHFAICLTQDLQNSDIGLANWNASDIQIPALLNIKGSHGTNCLMASEAHNNNR